MKVRALFVVGVLVTILTVLQTGCNEEPENEVQKLVDELVTDLGEVNIQVLTKLVKYGPEAIEPLRIAAENSPRLKQYCYSHALISISAEPARFEACKKLLKHPNIEVRKHAVEGLAIEGAPDEAIELCIKLATDAEEPALRGSALRMLSYCKVRKFEKKICQTLRRGTSDGEQMVREHAQRGLDRMKACQ